MSNLPSLAPSRTERPNVLLFITDDQGWGGLSSHGNTMLETPVLDTLAEEGARFDRYFVSPVCAPTRASLLTGRYHPRTGIIGIRPGLDTIRSEEVTIAEALKPAGYATGCFGKWHNGTHYPYTPPGRGFDEFLGFCAGHWSNYFDTKLEHNGRMAQTQGYITDVLADAAIGFIRQHHDEPFFCFVPFNAPHVPSQVPDRYFDKYKAKGLDDWTACSYGMTENVDDNVGRILETLKELQIADDTVVIFTTDHGPDNDRYNGGMRGRKKSFHEGGVRVPLLIRWPARIRPGTKLNQLAAEIDLLPTIVDLCGIDKPQTLPLDGLSLAPLLTGRNMDWPDRMIFTYTSRCGIDKMTPCAVRTDRYRLVNPGSGYELYDMIADPTETTDIAGAQVETTMELATAYEVWFSEVTKNLSGRMPIPVGYDAVPDVELPVVQGRLSNGLRFYAQAPGWNHDWVTDWSRPQESISWEVDVVHPDAYEVSLVYTCPQRDVGATIRVEVSGQSLEATISEAFDPDPLTSPDRVARNIPYEKDWARLSLGSVHLDPGLASVTVRAVRIPGEQAFELSAVRLRRAGAHTSTKGAGHLSLNSDQGP